MARTPSRLEDCDHENKVITHYCGCFSVFYAPHGCESCREGQETLKVHRNRLRKKRKRFVKASSEILVRPKKSFSLQRLSTCSSEAKDKKRKMQFQYDPKSYALNFDDESIKEGDGVFLDFSTRYACPLGINNVYLRWEHSEA